MGAMAVARGERVFVPPHTLQKMMGPITKALRPVPMLLLEMGEREKGRKAAVGRRVRWRVRSMALAASLAVVLYGPPPLERWHSALGSSRLDRVVIGWRQ